MKPYHQSTKYTCGASSLAMIINHFNPDFKLNQQNEFEIWNHSVALPLRGSNLFGLALYAHNKNIPCKVIVGKKEFKFPGYRFKAYKKKEVEIADKSSSIFIKRLKDNDIQIEERDFNLDEIKSLLTDGKVLLLRLIIGTIRQSTDNKRTSHYIPITSFSDNKFEVFDPGAGRLLIPEKRFRQSFEKVKEVKRDNRMIVFG
ncbi:peptidase C39 family protein [Nanoarchaeota archaeon]